MAVAPKKKATKTIEQTYQKKTQLEHILLRPDTYGAIRFPQQPPRVPPRS